MLPLAPRLAYAGALLSGLLYWLAFAGMDVWVLTPIAWVPLVVAMHRQPAGRAARLGWLAGLTMNFAGFFWLQEMLKTFSGFPTPVCIFFVLVVCAYQGGRIGLLGWLYGRATARGWPAAPVFAAAFAASELVYPLLFPWYYAATVHQVPVLTQVADLGGPIGVGLVLVTVNLALAEPLLARLERRSASRGVLGAGAAALGLACAYGLLRIRTIDAAVEAAPGATVGVVQANMGLIEKRVSYDEGLRRHLDLSRSVEKSAGVDFVVWSETSAMRPVRDDSYVDDLGAGVGARIVREGSGTPAIFGAVVLKPVGGERRYVAYNVAVASDARGAITSRYDKQYLLAFGEYLPFGETFPILHEWSPHSGRFSQGTSLEPVELDVKGTTHKISVLICYEDILPSFTNRMVAHADPELLVNITNDAWFGDTTEPWEHLALSKFRAIEHRRFLVRSTNSGVSAIVDPMGGIVTNTKTFVAEAQEGTVRWMRGHTVYEMVGDVPWWLLALAMGYVSFARRGRSRSTAASV